MATLEFWVPIICFVAGLWIWSYWSIESWGKEKDPL